MREFNSMEQLGAILANEKKAKTMHTFITGGFILAFFVFLAVIYS